MIFVYTLVLMILGLVKFLVERRASFLAWRHARQQRLVDGLLREPVFKEGNSSKPNTCKAAQRYYLLGRAAQKKDRIEAKHYAWLGLAEKLARFSDGLRRWKGKKLPYTLGALDVWLFLFLIDELGVRRYLGGRKLLEWLTALWSS